MDMSGQYRIAAPREKVWEALNDPEILKQSIPGCEELEKTADNELTAKVRARVGPVNARFTGKVTLKNLNPPASYTIEGEGQGGAAGFAKGGADVSLTEDGSETVLNYTAHANVGGKLAQLGGRLIAGTAKKMADQFFGKFAEVVGAPVAGETVPEAEAPAPTAAEPEREPEPAAEPEPAPAEPAPEEAAAAEAAERHIQATAAHAGEMPPPTPGPSTSPPQEPASAPGAGMSPVTWITGLVVLVLVLVLIYTLS